MKPEIGVEDRLRQAFQPPRAAVERIADLALRGAPRRRPARRAFAVIAVVAGVALLLAYAGGPPPRNRITIEGVGSAVVARYGNRAAIVSTGGAPLPEPRTTSILINRGGDS